MREALILAYAAAIGFAAAGFISSVIQLVTRQPVAFAVPERGVLAYFWAALRFAFIGPYIIARRTFQIGNKDQGAAVTRALGITVAVIWSTCSGIVVLSLALSAASA